MVNLDYAPAVFAGIIIFVILAPSLYGIFLVDKFWKKNQQDKSAGGDAFN